MKRFVGHLVEGKIAGTFGDVWVRMGLYRSLELAELAAEIGPSLDERVGQTRITPYYRLSDERVLETAQPVRPAVKSSEPARSPLAAAFRSRAGEVCRQAF